MSDERRGGRRAWSLVELIEHSSYRPHRHGSLLYSDQSIVERVAELADAGRVELRVFGSGVDDFDVIALDDDARSWVELYRLQVDCRRWQSAPAAQRSHLESMFAAAARSAPR